MKRVLYSTLACLMVALVGCQSSDDLVDPVMDGPIDTPATGKKVILTANIQGASDSRVALTPGEDANGRPIVKVDWKDSEESFMIYGTNIDGNLVGSRFEQIEGYKNKFEGTELENCNQLLAFYGNHILVSNSIISYDISEQDGTLNEDYVIMTAGLEDFTSNFNFAHKTAILKTTFKMDGQGVNDQISQVVVSDAYASSSDKTPTNAITVTRTPGEGGTYAEDIYIFLLRDRGSYANHTFTFSVTINGVDYAADLTIPEGKDIEAGKFYTTTINLPSVALLPNGEAVREAVYKLVGIDAGGFNDYVIFEVASERKPEDGQLIQGATDVYIKMEEKVDPSANERKAYIYTQREVMKFHANCSNMFKKPDGQSVSDIYSISFPETGIDTSEVTDMSGMFQDCDDLYTISFGGFSTANVTDMCGLFSGCSDLHHVNLSGFNTEKVTDMSNMFNDCFDLTSLDLSSFNTANVTTMAGMFNIINHSGNEVKSQLENIVFGENFTTGKVTTMVNMFSYCEDLIALDLSSFDTSNVTDMSGMFDNCSRLTNLDLSHFNTAKVTTMANMFSYCANMQTLMLDKFSIESIDKTITDVSIDNGATTTTTIDYTGLRDMFLGLGSNLSGEEELGGKTHIYINMDLHEILGDWTNTSINNKKAFFSGGTGSGTN